MHDKIDRPGRRLRLLLSLAVLVLAAGCASMTEDECRSANWHALGNTDAHTGEIPDYGAERAKSCNEKGVPANMAEWRRGWEQGRRELCTPSNAAAWARRDRDYPMGLCPPELEPAFLSVYQPARERYRFEKHVRDLERQIDERSRKLDDVERQLRHGRNLSPQQRADLEARRRTLEREIRRLHERLRTDALLRMSR